MRACQHCGGAGSCGRRGRNRTAHSWIAGNGFLAHVQLDWWVCRRASMPASKMPEPLQPNGSAAQHPYSTHGAGASHHLPQPSPPADYDGSSSQRTGPTIAGAWPSWWQIADDCSYEVLQTELLPPALSCWHLHCRPLLLLCKAWHAASAGRSAMHGAATRFMACCACTVLHVACNCSLLPLPTPSASHTPTPTPSPRCLRTPGTPGCAPSGRAWRWGVWRSASPGSPWPGTAARRCRPPPTTRLVGGVGGVGQHGAVPCICGRVQGGEGRGIQEEGA